MLKTAFGVAIFDHTVLNIVTQRILTIIPHGASRAYHDDGYLNTLPQDCPGCRTRFSRRSCFRPRGVQGTVATWPSIVVLPGSCKRVPPTMQVPSNVPDREAISRIANLADKLSLCLSEVDSLEMRLAGIHLNEALELVKDHLRLLEGLLLPNVHPESAD